jgi:Ca2+-binding RTX toxin-like protein
MNLRTQLEGNSFAELIMRNTTAHTLKADSFATADCKFQLSSLAGTPAGYEQYGNKVNDDPATQCDESALLIRMPDGTIKYRSRNTVDKPGINGQSVYNGTDGDDRISGGNDNDTVWGDEGNDRIEGGAGNDIALGGEGDDILTDAAGDDFLKGGPGNDAIDAGPGLDTIAGGDGKDFINGGANINETFAGEGDDMVIAGDGDDTVFGDSGDDWAEGGNGNDTLQGDSGNPFTLDDGNKPGNDVLIGQGGDDEYDMEGGDDIAVQGPGSEKTLGGSGFDWSVASSPVQGGDDESMIADLSKPIEPAKAGVLDGGVRDRYKEVEALSGGAHDDVLTGDDAVPTSNGGNGGGLLGCDALDAAGVARIAGLNQVVTSLSTSVAAVGNVTGRDCDLHGSVWGAGNILLGGPGNDTIDGRGGNDIIDGDRYLTVRLSVRDADGHEIRSARSMTELQADVFASKINPKDIVIVREILTSPTADTDTAVFAGARSAYTVHTTNGVTTVVGPDGTDTVRNIEKLTFDDTTVTLTPPAVPGNVVATAGTAKATVTWTAPADVNGLPVTGYTVERIGGPAVDVAATTTSFVATGLVNGTSYTFRVRALNEAGASVYSDPSNAVVPVAPVAPPAVRPGQASDVTATEGDGSAVVGWTPPASPGSSAVTGYDVQVLDIATLEQVGALRPAAADATTLTVTGLTNGTTYWFRVRAVNTVGAGAWSNGSAPVTPVKPAVAPAAPALGAASAGNAAAVVRWTAPATDGGADLTGYEIQVLNAAGVQVGALRPAGAPLTQLIVTGLVNGTAYRFRVRAVNAVGAGDWSATSATVTPATTPVVPGSLSAARGGNGGAITATLQWSAPAGTGGSAITGYRVTRQRLTASGAATGAASVVTVSAGSRSMTFTAPAGVPANTGYRFTVQAVNTAGLGAARSVVSTVR